MTERQPAHPDEQLRLLHDLLIQYRSGRPPALAQVEQALECALGTALELEAELRAARRAAPDAATRAAPGLEQTLASLREATIELRHLSRPSTSRPVGFGVVIGPPHSRPETGGPARAGGRRRR